MEYAEGCILRLFCMNKNWNDQIIYLEYSDLFSTIEVVMNSEMQRAYYIVGSIVIDFKQRII